MFNGKPRWAERPEQYTGQLSELQDGNFSGSRNRDAFGILPFHVI